MTGETRLSDAQAACLSHAEDLVRSARAVLGVGHANIAYHLAALALEELGKRHLLAIRHLSSAALVPPAWPAKHAVSHIQKLFWCFFDGTFTAGPLTAERLSSMRSLAHEIHSTRLTALYVDEIDGGLSIPSQAVDRTATENLIQLADNILAQARLERASSPPSTQTVELQRWFLEASEDPLLRTRFFSSASLAKLAALGDVRAWVTWHRSEIERATQDALQTTQAELEKSREPRTHPPKPKWKVRLRIETQSHAIRPKALRAWNESFEWIQLSASAKKKSRGVVSQDLLVDILFLDNLPLDGLWQAGLATARRFLVALNIATRGFWWWHMPQNTSRYYEEITDLERTMQIAMDRNPELVVGWGDGRVLDDPDVSLLRQVFAILPMPDALESRAYEYYLGGLTFLSINNIHWQCEPQALGNFLECLRHMLMSGESPDSREAFVDSVRKALEETFPDLDNAEKERIIALASAHVTPQADTVGANLRDVAMIKTVCDLLFLQRIRPRLFSERRASTEAQGK